MSVLVLIPPKKALKGLVKLPSSKSLSNRALIIRALCNKHFPIYNLSEAGDTRILAKALKDFSLEKEINLKDAGTAMRFMTAFVSIHPGEFILKGSPRMHERPVGPLVEALHKLGTKIEYLEKPGYPPLKVKGSKLTGGKITIDAGISSQFISSLLMVAPQMKDGLRLILSGTQQVSKPYIEMTLDLMKFFGIKSNWIADEIRVFPGTYQAREITIEPDWTAASYFYAMLLLSHDGRLYFPGLKKNSLQGDCIAAKWFQNLGVVTSWVDQGAWAAKAGSPPDYCSLDFTDNPDLAQTMLVAFAGAGIKAMVTGLQTLPLKETDRIKALQSELKKAGFEFAKAEGNSWILNPERTEAAFPIVFDTWNDHRMAMSFAPLSIAFGKIKINNPEVVEKSYPGFWAAMQHIGFNLRKLE